MPARLLRNVELTMYRLPAGVRPGVAEPVVLGGDVVDDRIAREALADVHTGVRASRGVRVLDRAVDRIEAVDAVVTVADAR